MLRVGSKIVFDNDVSEGVEVEFVFPGLGEKVGVEIEGVGDAIMIGVDEVGEAAIEKWHGVVAGEDEFCGMFSSNGKGMVREVSVEVVGVNDVRLELAEKLVELGNDAGVIKRDVCLITERILDVKRVNREPLMGIFGFFVAVGGNDGDMVAKALELECQSFYNHSGTTFGARRVIVV